MEEKLKSTVIKLGEEEFLCFQKMKHYTKFGYNGLFKNTDTGMFYDVYAFSKPLLQINNLRQHIQGMIKVFKSLNSKILSPILHRIEDQDIFYLVSEAKQFCLADLVAKRQGLTQYQIMYFITEFFEIVNYSKSRDLYFEKINLQNIYLNSNMKISIPFNLFFNKTVQKNLIRRLPFRKEAKDRNNCPDLYGDQHDQKNINLVNSWNLGVYIYQLLENKKPFQTNCSTAIISHASACTLHEHSSSFDKKFYQLKFSQKVSPELKQLISKLLQVKKEKRLNFPLVIIQPFFKNCKQIPHLLPQTVFTCPPSQKFKQDYLQNFHLQDVTPISNQKLQTKTQVIFSSHEIFNKIQSKNNREYQNKTQKYIKPSDRCLSQNKVYIQQWIDISHLYGFGYQMNTGTLAFVFNDGTQFSYPKANRKDLIYLNQKKIATAYISDKLPQEEDLKKKIFILQGYSKSIKKFKSLSISNEKIVTVSRYVKTKHASLFYLSNDSIQIFFNDKICFLLTKTNLYLQSKNNDKYEKYDFKGESVELKARRQYINVMAKKIFCWKNQNGQDQENSDNQSILKQVRQESVKLEKQNSFLDLKQAKQKNLRDFIQTKKLRVQEKENEDLIIEDL